MSRNNQKVLVLTLAIVLMFNMCIPVAADSTSFDYNEVSYGEVSSGLAEVKMAVTAEAKTLYSFEASWDDLVFVYEFTDWDPGTQQYTGGGWNKTEASIVVVNNSNADATLGVIYEEYYNTVAGATVELEATGNNISYFDPYYSYYDSYYGSQCIYFNLGSADGSYFENHALSFIHVDGIPTNAEAVTEQAVGRVSLIFNTGWW